MADPQTCRGYGSTAPHSAEPSAFNPGKTRCKSCTAVYFTEWRKRKQADRRSWKQQSAFMPDPFGAHVVSIENASAEAAGEPPSSGMRHTYRPSSDLVSLWRMIHKATRDGSPPDALAFFGPSGCGKTDGARHLAEIAKLTFTKVDAASMVDAESWFGTREVTSRDGVSVTEYRPSEFVNALQRSGVLFIDEVNRSTDSSRNVWLPLLDGTRRVSNPLTGDVISVHPKCFVIMAGNRGLQFTGTFSMDVALLTRTYVHEFDYADPATETQIAMEAAPGVSEQDAALLVRFATDVRAVVKSGVHPDLNPVSTREIIKASRAIAHGLKPDLAVRYAILNAASNDGGEGSVRATLETLWVAVRKAIKAEQKQPEGSEKVESPPSGATVGAAALCTDPTCASCRLINDALAGGKAAKP